MRIRRLTQSLRAGNSHWLSLWATHQKVEFKSQHFQAATVDFLILNCLVVSSAFAFDQRISQMNNVNAVYVNESKEEDKKSHINF